MLANLLRKGLQFRFQVRIDGLLLAVLYVIAFSVARQSSADQFSLFAGVRVGALLLTPVRLWPYLVLGEYVYLGVLRYPLIEQLGVAWVVLGSGLVIPLVALIVRVHRRPLDSMTGKWLLSLSATVAVLIALLNVSLSQLLWASPPSISYLERAVRQVFGNLIGILTVAPIALLWLQRRSGEGWRSFLTVPTTTLLASMAALGLVAANVPASYSSLETTLQILMAAPAAALTCLHGWRGAALAVPLLNVLVGLTMPSTGAPWSFDSSTFTVQQILVVTSAALFAMGTRISNHYNCYIRYKNRSVAKEQVVAFSRHSHTAGEQGLRERAIDINRIGEGIDFQLSETADWLKRHGHEAIAFSLIRTSVFYSRKFRAQASLVYPTALEHVGLYLALQVGGISEIWDNTERMLQSRLIGDPCRLSVALQLSAYRTLTDAVSLLLQAEKGKIRVNARCGEVSGRRGILVVVEIAEAWYQISESTRAKAIETLTGRTLTHGGTVQCRRNRIRILLLEN